MKKITLKQKIRDYFNIYLPENEGEVADIESFAVYLGITRDELTALEMSEECGREVALAKSRIAAIKKQLAFRGKIPAAVLSFDFKNNHGYRDRAEPEPQVTSNTLILQGEAGKWSE